MIRRKRIAAELVALAERWDDEAERARGRNSDNVQRYEGISDGYRNAAGHIRSRNKGAR